MLDLASCIYSKLLVTSTSVMDNQEATIHRHAYILTHKQTNLQCKAKSLFIDKVAYLDK